MSTRLTQLNLVCITAANLNSCFKKNTEGARMRAPFFAPSTATKELGRLFNQISVYREQHRT